MRLKCMRGCQKSINKFLLQRYPYLGEDSLYRDSTEAFIKRTITPVMASLAELIRCKIVISKSIRIY